MNQFIKRLLLIATTVLFVTPNFAQDVFKLPDYTKFQLKNGLTIYLMEQHEVPCCWEVKTIRKVPSKKIPNL